MTEAPICPTCNVRRRERRMEKDYKTPVYRPQCRKCRYPTASRGAKAGRRNYRGRPWHDFEKCARCGFVPEHPVQMDVDHIDGDRTNDDPSNHQVLCANCHRLKTAGLA